ncbi:hypothetical protein HOV93_19880 [Planctomycetes bacterium FF15]|uniref:Uncharacterized protein n=2 Tax=Bremerella alba TaxID=980252 RepID=A0A7V8V4W5_9BACT|nr:hypothetical protein [Bremerella alba]
MNGSYQHATSWLKWTVLVLAVPAVYVLSSGPVIGLAFWLREATGWDGFYHVMWFYLPILMLGHENPLAYYIEWWVIEVFDTVGPG